MTTLRIEHAIHDYDLWKTAFDGFADVRTKAGVNAFTIRRPVDNPKYLMLDLEFDTTERAALLLRRSWSRTSGRRQSPRRAWPAHRKLRSST